MPITRSRSYHHGDLRAELLQRAEATLRESGVDGLSLRRLARDVGVSHAAPTRHFKDKQALLDAIAVSGFERLAAALERTAAAGSIDGHIRALARTYLRFATENPALVALMFARRHSPAAGDAMSHGVDAAFATPVALISEAQQLGEVIEGDPRRIALSAVATLQGLATFVGSGVIAAETAEELLDETITHMIDGLRPR
ncbi:TetR/AcrR family transcriptional regulator [Nocardia abscessus]|uniref:TetR/AcrR family transcriptional regulator n=1 Tax=Nocardia TaxID=1817 RepID=UPI0018952E0B|nr:MULTISPECIES: TetR/AcrR family transcriptional regulator [Nocardia]MBF6221554.1 TetR/AcrR family transcriptional regulator [Nocardia abscessus]MDE1674101.1 TetR/AcrR family transcriptional regulator [Nocardia gipuzkoensis]